MTLRDCLKESFRRMGFSTDQAAYALAVADAEYPCRAVHTLIPEEDVEPLIQSMMSVTNDVWDLTDLGKSEEEVIEHMKHTEWGQSVNRLISDGGAQ